jgi:hypothetical protein
MRRVFCILVSLVFIQCGESPKRTEISEMKILSDCFNNKEMVRLNEGLTIFKQQLKSHYKVEEEINIATYKRYLSDFSKMTLPRDFFSSKKAKNYLSKIKETSTFKVLYKKYEEPKYENELDIPITTQIGEQEKKEEELPDFIVFNGKGKFSKCLLEKSNNKDLKDYLNAIDEFVDLSPTIKASAMSEIIKKAGEDKDIVVLSITFDLFYGSVLMFNSF